MGRFRFLVGLAAVASIAATMATAQPVSVDSALCGGLVAGPRLQGSSGPIFHVGDAISSGKAFSGGCLGAESGGYTWTLTGVASEGRLTRNRNGIEQGYFTFARPSSGDSLVGEFAGAILVSLPSPCDIGSDKVQSELVYSTVGTFVARSTDGSISKTVAGSYLAKITAGMPDEKGRIPCHFQADLTGPLNAD
ncbi:MAG TPA: hypothetical protein VI541_03450 [Actinomycetota bacterium]|nr:hypothetical protein [Actinomycetota bacterium]